MLSSEPNHHHLWSLSGQDHYKSHSAGSSNRAVVRVDVQVAGSSGSDLSDLEGVSREDIFSLTSPSRRSPAAGNRQTLSVSSGSSSQKMVAAKRVSPFGRGVGKKAPSVSATSGPSSPHSSDLSTSIFDLAAIGSSANPYLSAAASAREVLEAAHLRLSARAYDQYQREEDEREESGAYGGAFSENSSVRVEMDEQSVDDDRRGVDR